MKMRKHALNQTRVVSSPIQLPLKLINSEMSKENDSSPVDNDVGSVVSNTSLILDKGGKYIDNQRANLKDPGAYMRRW